MTTPVLAVRVLPSRYVDSLVAMRLAKDLAAGHGVLDVAVLMGTPANLELLRTGGFLGEGDRAGAEDLVVAVKAIDETSAHAALDAVEPSLSSHRSPTSHVRTLDEALAAQPASNLVSISLPGAYAAAEATRALAAGLHVFCFSSDVALADEVAMKELARSKGLLCMGPDCGTAILGGVGLGFANAVGRGPVGLVGGSGTGLQAVTSLLDRMGIGTSHAIGAGSRDLHDEVAGSTTLAALQLLDEDPGTEVIVVVSKPGDAATMAVLEEAAATSRTPVVLCVLGADGDVATLEDAALAAAATLGVTATPIRWEDRPEPAETRARLGARRDVRGLYSGGSLCAEAQVVLAGAGLQVASNAPVAGSARLGDDEAAHGHALVDLGTAAFTRGRPHPMIDARARVERLAREARDPDVAVVLLDVVLGRNAAPDPAGDLAPAIKEVTSGGSGVPLVVASVVGTEADPQQLSHQVATLRAAGALVAPTNAQAAAFAAAVVMAPQP